MTTPTPDLFGQGAAQSSLFGEGLMEAPRQEVRVDPVAVRARLLKMLAEVRLASALPWNERTTRMNEIIFPQMANWLPADEAEQLRLEFVTELQRLKRAA